MYKFHKLFYRWAAIGAVLLLTAAVSAGEPLGLGRAATAEDIAAWDIDVRYDGKGLPPGRGDVARGEVLFDSQCASCHGDFGQGEGRWPALTGAKTPCSTKERTVAPKKRSAVIGLLRRPCLIIFAAPCPTPPPNR